MSDKVNTPMNLRGIRVVLWLLLMAQAFPLRSQTPVGTEIQNVARYAYHTLGGIAATANSDTTTTIVAAGSQIEITKTASASVVTPGDSLIYTISLTNTGNAASGQITVRDTLDTRFIYLESTPAATITGQVLEWTLDPLESGATIEVQLIVDIASQVSAGRGILNIASYVMGQDPPVSSAPALITVGSAPALELTKSVNVAEAVSLDTLHYDLLLRNSGNTPSENTVLRDNLPPNVEVVSISGNGSHSGEIITWNLGTLEPDESTTQQISVIPMALTPVNTLLVNSASVSNAQNVTRLSQAETLVNPWVLPIEKSADPGPYAVGDTIRYLITLDNTQNESLIDVVVTDTLPDLLDVISTTPQAQIEGQTLSWILGTLDPMTSLELELMARVAYPEESLASLMNVASVQSINGGTDQDTAEVDLTLFPEFELVKRARDVVTPGDTLRYTLTYGNTGLLNASGTILIDSLPAEVTLLSAEGVYDFDETYRKISWSIGDLQSGLLDSVTVTTLVASPLEDQTLITNNAWLVSNEIQSDTVQSMTRVESSAVLQIAKHAPPLAIPGDTLHYNIQVQNVGTALANGVTLVDSLPNAVEFIAADQGGIYDPLHRVVTWDLGILNVSELYTRSVSARIRSDIGQGQNVVNHVRVSSQDGETASAEAVTQVRTPILDLQIRSDSLEVIAGSSFMLHLDYQNLGDTLATDVTLIDTLPPELEYLSSSSGGDYDPDEHTVTWRLGDIPPQGGGATLRRKKQGARSGSLDIEVRVTSPITNNSILVNKAYIVSAEDVSAYAEIQIRAISGPFIALTKQAEVEVFPGDTIHYQLDYWNRGSDVAHEVTIIDTLDTRLTYLQSSGVYDGQDHSITWNLGDLEAGGSGRLEFQARMSTELGDGESVSNRAWVTSAETHPTISTWATTNILPMSMALTSSPKIILGNGEASSELIAEVFSFLGNPAPDGIPVSFQSTEGSIPAEVDTVTLMNGVAYSSIIADTVVAESIEALITARADYSAEKFTSDTTTVIFIIGAFEGYVYDYSGNPIEDVQVELVQLSSGETEGIDSTDAAGYYLIPVYFEEEYLIRYSWVDAQGNPIVYEQVIVIDVPENGNISTNLNSISGWIYDELTGEPIIEEGIQVTLTLNDQEALGKTSSIAMADTSVTDSTGRYFFTNLPLGTYDITVNYLGVQSYNDGSIQVRINQPGVFVANANVSLRQSPYFIYKQVTQKEAMVGDTLDYQLVFGAYQQVTDSVKIVDYLPSGLRLLESSINVDDRLTYESYDPVSNEVSFLSLNVPQGEELSIGFKAEIARDISDVAITNTALVASRIDTSYSYRDARSDASTQIIFPFLKMTKAVGRRVVEPGDFLTYSLTLENTSLEEHAVHIVVEDLIPKGFKYRLGTSFMDNEAIDDPLVSSMGKNRQALSWTLNDTLDPAESLVLKYRLICGLESDLGYAVNEAFAQATTLDGFALSSNLAEVTVEVSPGILSNRGVIFGKAFYDDNQNGIQDPGEMIQEDIELIFQDGARIFTDADGKYSIPNVMPGTHVLRVNPESLPEDVLVRDAYFRQLGNPESQLIQMGHGAFLKINIPLIHLPKVPGQIQGRVLIVDKSGVIPYTEAGIGPLALSLNDSLVGLTDSSGQFQFADLLPGDYSLAMDLEQLPKHLEFLHLKNDSMSSSSPAWQFTISGGDTAEIELSIDLKEMEVALSNHATLRMSTKMLTQEFRLMVYKPWVMLLRLGFVSGQASLTEDVIPELRKVGDLLRWQTQLNLDIIGHTDNVPLSEGGVFATNLELSSARASSIETFLVDQLRISADRIQASGKGDSLPLVPNDSEENRALNRRVELVFYNAPSDDSDLSHLDFEFHLDYTGEISLDSLHFNQVLPPGFRALEGTGQLKEQSSELILDDESKLTWSFGDWDERKLDVFDFTMLPGDFEQIAPISTVTTYLEYTDPFGQRVITDSLQTRLSTMVEELSFNMVLKGTQFDVGSADLKSSAFASLEKLGEFMTWQPDIRIVIEGFTDDRGSLELNMALSAQRAESVRSFLLTNYDLNPDNIQVHGLGPHYPVASNDTWQGRAANRRVEVLVNAEVGEAALMEAEIVKEALSQELSFPEDPFVPEWRDSTLVVEKGGITRFWVDMIDPVPQDYENVRLSLDLPEGIVSARNASSKIVILAQPDDMRRIHELIELETESSLPEGLYSIHVEIQRLDAAGPAGPVETRTVELYFQ